MPSLSRPDVDALREPERRHRRRPGADGRQRPLHARHGHRRARDAAHRLQPARPSRTWGRRSTSASTPRRACARRARGSGRVTDLDLDELVDHSKSLNEGAIRVPGYTTGRLVRADLHRVRPVRPGHVKVARLHRPAAGRTSSTTSRRRSRLNGINLTYEGLVPKVQRSILTKDRESDAAAHRAPSSTGSSPTRPARPAAAPGSTRPRGRRGSTGATSPTARRCRSATWPSSSAGLTAPEVAPLVATLRQTLDSLVEIGLGYLSLDRESGTLSGGEAQRVKMVRHLGSRLTDVTYVFDEPTVGLHPHDIQRMNDLLLRLRDKGNTVLVVEHKPETIADRRPCGRPRARAPARPAGRCCFEGTVAGLRSQRHADRPAPGPPGPAARPRCVRPTGALPIRGATTAQPAGRRRRRPARRADRRHRRGGLGQELADPRLAAAGTPAWSSSTSPPIRGSRRSNPATYTGLLDPIRTAFAKANEVKPALFSANSEGACPNCKGIGLVYTDLAMMAGVASVCEQCEGKRFTGGGARRTSCDGKDISEVLAMSVDRGAGLLRLAGRRARSWTGWPTSGSATSSLGQPLTTLSGGERQRLKLAIHMADKGGDLRPRRADHRPAPGRRRPAARPARPAGRRTATR